MYLKHLALAAGVAVGGLASANAAAQSCAGFADVPSTDTFCQNIEWVRNRAITLGCNVAQTAYCPKDTVTREQMAAFMNRVGTALTPTFVRKSEPQLPALNFSGQQILCKTATVPATAYPRAAIVRGLVNLYTPDGGMDIEAKVVFSTDNGVNWQNSPTGDGLAYGSLYPSFAPPHDVSLNPMTAIDLNAATAYMFALAARRTAGTGEIANVYCENLVQLVNRNGSSSPFDLPQDARPAGRGS